MIKNNKGFMLAEVVIVSAILITTLVSLYVGFARVYKAYEERSSFFDTDSIYALKSIEDTLIDEAVFNNIINEIEINGYVLYEKNNISTNSYINTYLKTIMENYNIDYFFITKYNLEEIENILDPEFDDVAFEDYLFYLKDNLEYREIYKYIFLSKTSDGRFAYLRVK